VGLGDVPELPDIAVASALACLFGVSVTLALHFRWSIQLRDNLDVLKRAMEAIGQPTANWAANRSPEQRVQFERALQSHYAAGRDAVSEAVSARVSNEEILAEMDSLWTPETNRFPKGDARGWEDACTEILGRSLHVLYPELVPLSKVYMNKEIETFFAQELKWGEGEVTTRKDKFKKFPPLTKDRRPDLIAKFKLRNPMSPVYGTKEGALVYLIVEAKNPSLPPINRVTVDEAFSYAYDLWKMLDLKSPVHFECLTVGGKIAPEIAELSRMEISGLATFTVTAVEWQHLRERFMQMTGIEAVPPVPIYRKK
jgi:hypothetical protein